MNARNSIRMAESRVQPMQSRRANSLVLVTAILVLLVIIASAFVVRSQSVRAQASSQQRAMGRNSRVESATTDVAQLVADALFARRIDATTYAKQVQANLDQGMDEPARGRFFARSDFPTLAPYPFAIRYEVDMFDGATGGPAAQDPGFDNRFLAPYASLADKNIGKVDGYNYASYAVNPFTNWPLRYGIVPGESSFRQWYTRTDALPNPPAPYPVNYFIPTNPRGNPGFGDSRWLASTEPVRAQLNGLDGLLLDSATNAAKLTPLGLGFSHWPHMSWIATPNNGYRVCWDISDLDANTLDGPAGTALGELSLGTPYEQWLSFVAPKKLDLVGQDSRGYLVPSWKDFRWRYAKWFNRVVPGQSSGLVRPDDPMPSISTITAAVATGHEQAIRGVNEQQGDAPENKQLAPPNFLQLAAYGDPSEEYKVFVSGETLPSGYQVGDPKPRNLISRTLADTDGDGWTDSFWFVAPTSGDRGTRQLVSVRIMDNSALLNVNTATTFERTSTLGQTPSDVALVSRRDAYDLTLDSGRKAANYDPAVGFFSASENDPEHRMNAAAPVLVPIRKATPTPAGPYAPSAWLFSNASDLRANVNLTSLQSVYKGLDVAWSPQSWEGRQKFTSENATVNTVTVTDYFYKPSILAQLGVIKEGRAPPGNNQNTLAKVFDTTDWYESGTSSAAFGDFFALSRPADRSIYFKAMANDGVVVDPVTATRLVELTPFGVDDEVELRGFNGLNDPQTTSRLEASLNWSFSQTSDTAVDQFLRSSRSREETARFLAPDDPRLADTRVRAAGFQQNGVERRAGYELLLDHRRLLTTVSGGRNETLPPRLWTLQAYGNGLSDQLRMEGALPAYDQARDQGGNVLYPPYHPNRVFPDAPLVNSPIWGSVADVDGDANVTETDFLIARQRFLNDNRKIDLRRPSDETAPLDVVGTTNINERESARSAADQVWARDVQRVMRRAMIDATYRSASGGAATDSFFGRPGASEAEKQLALSATKGLAASFAANLLCYRDSVRGKVDLYGAASDPISIDPPLFPSQREGVPWPGDAAKPMASLPQPNSAGLNDYGFIGVECQPVIQEVFIALVYPPYKVEEDDFSNSDVEYDAAGGCDEATAVKPTIIASDNGRLPEEAGSRQFIAAWKGDVNDKNGKPVVVCAIQIANPFNKPIKLSEYFLRIKGKGGDQTFRFFRNDLFSDSNGRVLETNPNNSDLVKWGNTYGADVELGPCTPEEPRSAIVFAVPDTFPNGDPFPRDAWLDFLDLRESIDLPGQNGNRDGTLTSAERNLADDSRAGGWFPPDRAALFRPAWGDDDQRTRCARGGTLLFDATSPARKAVKPDGTPGELKNLPSYMSLETHMVSSADLRLWEPPGDDAAPYIELVRFMKSAIDKSSTAEVVVDRFDNTIDPSMRSVAKDSFIGMARHIFKDPVANSNENDAKYRVPPFKVSYKKQGGVCKWLVDGVRLGGDDVPTAPTLSESKSFATWVRGSRQWLFDVNGDGRIATNERVPRFAFARMTGAMGSAAESDGQQSETKPAIRNGERDTPACGIIINPLVRVPDSTVVDGTNVAADAWLQRPYTNVWGDTIRGKPVFFGTRVFESGTLRVYPPCRSVVDPDDQWSFYPTTGNYPVRVSYGEKGPTDPADSPGTDWVKAVAADPLHNFLSPYRLFQKDADFDQVAEILDVPMWGPLVSFVSRSGSASDRTTYLTLPEILAMPAALWVTSTPSAINLPKLCASALEQELTKPDARTGPRYGSLQQQISLNRLSIDPPVYDIPWNPTTGSQTGAGSAVDRPTQLTGSQVLPSAYNTPGEMPIPQQNGIGFNNRLPGVVSLLDAFTLDDRGAAPLDTNLDNSISPSERADAEYRRLRLAGGFAGKRTPGLININTAPVEVLRAMPHMTRLAYDDDFQIAFTANSDPANLKLANSVLSNARRIRDPLRWDWSPALRYFDGGTGAAGSGGASPFPTVRVADSIEIWRNKLNPLTSNGQWTYPELPSYADRGLSYGLLEKFKEFAPDMRVERGFESIGELGLLLRGASGQVPAADMHQRVGTSEPPPPNGTPDVREIAAGELRDLNRNGVYDPTSSISLSPLGGPDLSAATNWGRAVSPSIRYGGFDPFRSSWDTTIGGDGGLGANSSTTRLDDPANYTDGVPLQTSGLQTFSIGGRTAIDPHRLIVGTDDPFTTAQNEADDAYNGLNFNPNPSSRIETEILRNDLTSGDAIEQNTLLKGISNIVTTRSDVFTVWVRVRTIRQNPLTGKWNATDPDQILDDSRYLMTVDRSSVDRPGDAPKILSYVRLPK